MTNPLVTKTQATNPINVYQVTLANLFNWLGIPPTQQFSSLETDGTTFTVRTTGT